MPRGRAKATATVSEDNGIREKVARIRLTFLDEILGSLPGDPELHETYIANKAPTPEVKQEEMDNMDIDEQITKGMTIFPTNKSGQRMLWPYQIKGYIKGSQKFLNLASGKSGGKYVTAYKSKIDQLVFIKPTDADWGDLAGVKINYPDKVMETDIPFAGDPKDWRECERPLRASTAQGERVAIAHSESCPPGSWIEFDVRILGDKQLMDNLEDWLDYGLLSGIGQWRNSGKGRFTWLYI